MNVLCIAGNLTKDPELRSTGNGTKVASFTVAINEGKDKTEFVNCIAWEKTAELINQYAKKGDRLSCSGKIQTRKWEKDGQTRYATELVVDRFDFPPKRCGTQDLPQAAQPSVPEEFSDEIPF